ncbi:response regulator transcription factor [Chlorobaculum limnaeum]|nr:response regulator transcription factor [Chlorobaculum limnaeum]
MRSVVIVQDDSDFRDSLGKFLQIKGCDVTALGSAIDFYDTIRKKEYDLAIIDPGLPDQDGFVIAKYLSSNTNTRILMISERSSIEDKLRAYESGAGFYLVKPVDFREIDSAAAALIQSHSSHNKDVLKKPLENNRGKWILKVDKWALNTPEGDEVSLTAKEFMLLERLATESSGGIVSREALLLLFGYPKNKHGNHSLESLVYRLRKKISKSQDTPIKTVNGLGYSFIARIVIL